MNVASHLYRLCFATSMCVCYCGKVRHRLHCFYMLHKHERHRLKLLSNIEQINNSTRIRVPLHTYTYTWMMRWTGIRAVFICTSIYNTVNKSISSKRDHTIYRNAVRKHRGEDERKSQKTKKNQIETMKKITRHRCAQVEYVNVKRYVLRIPQ